MKKITILLLLTFAINSFAQINEVDSKKTTLIGKIGPLNDVWFKIEKSGDTYLFTYKDMKYAQLKNYKTFSFNDVDFENFYMKLASGINAKKKDEVTIDIPDGLITLKFGKTFGKGFVEIYHTDKAGVTGVTTWIDSKKLNKLFGLKQ